MTNSVKITLSGDSREVDRAIAKMNGSLDKANLKMERLKKGSKGAASDTANGFRRAGQAVSSTMRDIALSLGGVGSVTSLLTASLQSYRAEMEKIKNLNERNRTEGVGFEQTLRDTLGAFVADPTLNEAMLRKRILQASDRTNALPATIAKALQTASSARGSISGEVGVKAVEMAAMLNPNNEEQMATLSGRFLDLSKISGSNDMEAIAGFFLNMGSAARVTNFEKIGANLMPGVLGLNKLGATVEEAAELTTAMTQISGDETGRLSTNAVLTVFNQLKSFTPQRATEGPNKGQFVANDVRFGEFVIPEKQVEDLFAAADDPMQQVDVLNRSPELFKAFSIVGSFQAKTEQAVLALLRGDESALAELNKSRETNKPISEEMRQIFREEIAGQRAMTPIARAQESQDAALSRSRIADERGGRLGSARRVFEEAISNVDLPGPDEFGPGFIGLGKEASLRRSFEARQKRIGTSTIRTPEDVGIKTLQELIGSQGKAGDRFRRFPAGSKEEADIQEAIRVLDEQKQSFESARRERNESAFEQRLAREFGEKNIKALRENGFDPDGKVRSEIIAELKKIARNTEQRPSPPRQTTRQSSAVSRGN